MSETNVKKSMVLVIGGGAFGTAIAQALSQNFEKVVMKVRSQDVYEAIKKGENPIYLKGLSMAHNIQAALTWEEVESFKAPLDLIVSALPSSEISTFFNEHENKTRFKKYFSKKIPLVSLSKGIDPHTLELCDDLFFDIFPEFREQFCFLSGPSFAHEIMQNQITLVTVAGRSKKVLEETVAMMTTDSFRVLASYDIKGVLLGGALKNILAIAGGVIEGLGYNHNTRAAMITRGIAEMLRFGTVYNARPETFYGLSGMGDLILTTTGDLSRNKTFGLAIAKGRKALEIIESQRSVVEGYKTTLAAHLISEKFEIRAPIFNGVYDVLYLGHDPREVIMRLMKSPNKFEIAL